MLDPIGMITAVGDAVAGVAKEITQHEALENAPNLQAALINQRMQDLLDEHRKEIADEDLAKVRQLIAAPDAMPANPT